MISIPSRLQQRNLNFVLIKPGEKAPIEMGWQKKIRRFDDKELQESLVRGLSYGVQSNNSSIIINGKTYFLVIVDFDKKEFQDKIINLFPETFTTTSGSPKQCYHLWFASDNNKAFKIHDEKYETLCDIIGAGNQVIAPGSKHPSGSNYSIVKDIPFAFVPYAELEAILKPHDKSPKKEIQVGKKYDLKLDDISSKLLDCISMKEILDSIGIDSSRTNTGCFKHSSKGGKCFSWNSEVAHCFHCDSSWNKYSLLREAKGFSNKETFDFIAERTGLEKELKISRKKFAEEKEAVNNPQKKLNKELFVLDRDGNISSVDFQKVAEKILEDHKIITVLVKSSEQIYIFEGGIYVPFSKGGLGVILESLIGKYCKNNVVDEVFGKIKRITGINFNAFEQIPLELIPLDNGVYNIKTQEFLPPNPKYYFTFKIPVKYYPEAKCPLWDKFVEETVMPCDIIPLQRWFGFCLYRRYSFKKALLLVGEKDTGKTVTGSVLCKMIGEPNISGLSLQKLSSGEYFAMATLHRKHLNFFDELKAQDLTDPGGLKIATGGGMMTGEIKHGEMFNFWNFAKIMFCCNKIPTLRAAQDSAYTSRWLLFPFLNQVSKEELDEKLLTKLEEELSGILNWSLVGLKTLLEGQSFGYTRTEDEVFAIMNSHSNPLFAFVVDCLENVEGSKITKEEMYEFYSAWCEVKKIQRISKEQLGRNLEKFCSYVQSRVAGSVRYWEHVNFKKSITVDSTYSSTLSTLSINLIRKYIDSIGLGSGLSGVSVDSVLISRPKMKNHELNESLELKNG